MFVRSQAEGFFHSRWSWSTYSSFNLLTHFRSSYCRWGSQQLSLNLEVTNNEHQISLIPLQQIFTVIKLFWKALPLKRDHWNILDTLVCMFVRKSNCVSQVTENKIPSAILSIHKIWENHHVWIMWSATIDGSEIPYRTTWNGASTIMRETTIPSNGDRRIFQ